MAAISLTISESEEQIISGIPRTISIEANVPATIFYTLDGSIPTTMSDVYTGPIYLPVGPLEVILKIFATNGTDNSAVITNEYKTNIIDNTRLPGSPVSPVNINNNISLFPFGTNAPQPQGIYLNPSKAGITVLDPNLPSEPNGFDADGNQAIFTNKPISLENYDIIPSQTNNLGEPEIGNIPFKADITGSRYPEEYRTESSDTSDKLFDPKALVIYQDASLEDKTNPPIINRQNFTLENKELIRDGVFNYTTADEMGAGGGSLLRQHYDPRTNQITYYYYDNTNCRWIISKATYEPNGKEPGPLYNMVFPRQQGSQGKVFPWIPFMRRVLT